MLLLIYWTNVLSGDHIKEYYQAMSLLWMSPVMESVSFMHASPNSRITSFYILTTYQVTLWVLLGVLWPWCMHLISNLNWDTRAIFEMLLFLLLITMLITWELPPRIDASMQTHRNYFWLLAGTPWMLQCIRLSLTALSSVLIQEFVSDPMLSTALLCPFFSLRFAHSLSSLRVIFQLKVVHLKCLNNPFLCFDVKV